jgi:hypothetical protein
MTGTDLRIEDDYFPIATSIMEIGWQPGDRPVHDGGVPDHVGQSDGLDGRRVQARAGRALRADGRHVDAGARGQHLVRTRPTGKAFLEDGLSGWSAPLYGAMGIDQFEAEQADGAQLASRAGSTCCGAAWDST